MATYEQIKKANDSILTIDIQGKAYAEVHQRVKAFRMVHPDGKIETELLSIENGVCVFRASVYDAAGNLLATGTAYEKEGSSFINKTSYIENCESSAVGRAVGFAGYGIDTSVASAEEVQNAIIQQKQQKEEPKEEPKKASENQLKIVRQIYEGRMEEMLAHYQLKTLEDMPMTLASKIIAATKKKGAEKK